MRKRTPPKRRPQHRGNGNGTGGYDMPAEPTDARPGTEAKVAALERRARQKVALWHPEDSTDFAYTDPDEEDLT